MKKLIFIIITFLSITTYAEIPIQKTTVANVLKKAMPAVVNIAIQGEIPGPKSPFLKREVERYQNAKNLLPLPKAFSGVGSGVIIKASQGLIVTNAHVVDMSKAIQVTLSDGRHFPAIKIGADNKTDLAVLKINADGLTDIVFANSNELQVGDFVAAIGSAFGLKQTVTAGIVSSLNRSQLGIEGVENFIQTDAPINPGNSGGALINARGQVVGINTALLTPVGNGGNVGVGFAIPSNMVKSVVSQLLKFGKVHRGIMGVIIQTLTPDIAHAFLGNTKHGAIVTKVLPYSPAANAKLKIGDIITQINGKPVKTNADVSNLLGLMPLNQQATMHIVRNGKPLMIMATTKSPEKTEEMTHKANPFLYGLTLKNITMHTPTDGDIQGVQIMFVKKFSPAAMVNISGGDIIISANHQKTANINALKKAVKLKKDYCLLHILNHVQSLFVVIKK